MKYCIIDKVHPKQAKANLGYCGPAYDTCAESTSVGGQPFVNYCVFLDPTYRDTKTFFQHGFIIDIGDLK